MEPLKRHWSIEDGDLQFLASVNLMQGLYRGSSSLYKPGNLLGRSMEPLKLHWPIED